MPDTPTDLARRRFLRRSSRAAMVAGLASSATGFAVVAARYLYPTRPAERRWQFVALLRDVRVGESRAYRSPAGAALTITRQADGDGTKAFTALSSTCPHLGCQVHWEPQNNRFFCPCHNGTFDRAGVATGGPPFDAGQDLPRFGLRVRDGMLFVEVPVASPLGDEA